MKAPFFSWWLIGLPLVHPQAYAADTGVDPAHKHAWGENIGWVSGASAEHEMSLHFDGHSGWLAGHAWGENVGWIRMGVQAGGPYANTSAGNWGVNLAADGSLDGYAWGENIGWINFGHPDCDARIDPHTGGFSGHAWGENIGWLVFGGPETDCHVRSLAFDTQPLGTPNWWLDRHGVGEDYDEGDGFPAHVEFVMDTDPNDAGSHLRVVELSHSAGTFEVVFRPSSPDRFYTLIRSGDLSGDQWEIVPGQQGIGGTGGDQSMHDAEFDPVDPVFYRVSAALSP